MVGPHTFSANQIRCLENCCFQNPAVWSDGPGGRRHVTEHELRALGHRLCSDCDSGRTQTLPNMDWSLLPLGSKGPQELSATFSVWPSSSFHGTAPSAETRKHTIKSFRLNEEVNSHVRTAGSWFSIKLRLNQKTNSEWRHKRQGAESHLQPSSDTEERCSSNLERKMRTIFCEAPLSLFLCKKIWNQREWL